MANSIYVRRMGACKTPNAVSGGNSTSDVVAMTAPAAARACIGATGARQV